MELKLRGQIINLRKLKRSDAQSIYQNAKDREIIRYTTLPKPYRLKNAQDFIKQTHRNLRKKKSYELGIELKETSEMIGMISLMKVNIDGNKNAEVGYWLGKKYWGRGIAKEALKLILDFGFKKLKLVRIYARVMHPNIPSHKLLEKCGFKYEGKMRKSSFRNGEWYDDLIYGVLKERYKK